MPERETFNTWIGRMSIIVGGVGLVAMTGVLFWQVFARYILHASPAWTEQVALVLTIWFVMLGAAAGVQDGFHIRIVEGVERMSPRWARRARFLAHVMTLAFGMGLVTWGVELVVRTWPNVVPTLPVTRGMVYLIIPISGCLMMLFSIGHLRTALRPERDQ